MRPLFYVAGTDDYRLAAVERLSNKFINSMTVLRPDLFTRLRVETVKANLEKRII